jgi:Flp pilus assembly protein CpaB
MSAPSLGGFLATRQGSLLLAVLCAICAAGVLIFALGRYKTNVAAPAAVPQASVLVATGEITKGMTGTEIAKQKLYKLEPVTATQVTAGALSDASQLGAQSATADILPGQQLTSTDFSELASVSLVLRKGERAIEVNASGAAGAVDITNPNSRVDIYGAPGATSSVTSSSDGTALASTGTSAPTGAQYALIQQNVRVLKPATATPVTIGNQSVGGSTLVLIVSRAHVPQLIADSGALYLVLRPGKSGALPVTPVVPTTTTTGAS